jgi:hypothetical protein
VPGHGGAWDLSTGSIDGVGFLSDTVTVTVAGPVRFHPGQVLSGDIVSVFDEDRGTFEGLKGEKLKLKIVPPEGDGAALTKVRIEILDASGVLLDSWKRKVKSSGKAKSVKYKLKSSGTFTLRVLSGDSSIGQFKFVTSHKLKSQAKSRTKKLKVDGSAVATVGVYAVKDTELSLSIKPLSGAPFPASLEIVRPDGLPFAVQGFPSGDGSRLLTGDVPLDQTGKYKVVVPGKKGDKYKVKLSLTPPVADGTVILD